MPDSPLITLGLAACLLASCASAPAVERRLLVKLAQPSTDAAAIAQTASGVAGVAVHYDAATSAEWHALTLSCPDETACEQATQRLRAATHLYDSVHPNARRRVTTP